MANPAPEYSECQHEHELLAYRDAVNGSRMYTYQCQECGRQSNWIRHGDLDRSRMDNAIPIDDGLRDRYWRRNNEEKTRVQRELIEEGKAQHKEEYYRYLASSEWRRKAARRLELNKRLFGGMCEICFDRKAVLCHHITYDRIYREWIGDLAAICQECHKDVHPEHQKERSGRGDGAG